LSDGPDQLGLRALLALTDLELHSLVLLDGPESLAHDLRVVNEHVTPATALGDEAAAHFGVEPLHSALSQRCNSAFLRFDYPYGSSRPSRAVPTRRQVRERHSSRQKFRECEATNTQNDGLPVAYPELGVSKDRFPSRPDRTMHNAYRYVHTPRTAVF